MVKTVLYMTSCALTLKLKTDIQRTKQLLHLKKVDYEEVRVNLLLLLGFAFSHA